MYQSNTILRGTISTLAFGGKGILRTPDQFVVFVPFTAPGDLVECRLVNVKKNYANAELIRVIHSGPDRKTPFCPYFGTCGGCQLQHLTYEAQAEYKRLSVQDAVKKVYPNAMVSITCSKLQWSYRTHVTLTLKAYQKGYKLGYYAVDNQSLIEVKECPIFCDKNDPIFQIVRSMIQELLPLDETEGKLKILKSSLNSYALSFHFKILPSNFHSVAKKHLKLPINGIRAKEKLSLGEENFSFLLDGMKFLTHPDAFLQAHPQVSHEIYRAIQNYFQQFPVKFLIDLYSGIGISSLLASPYASRVEGIEFNKKAIELAILNAKNLNVKNVHFEAMKVEDALENLLKQTPEAAIVNPPREGLAKEVAFRLSESGINRLLYISCQPQTLARDLDIFKKKGFQLDKVQAFDMFPQTGHVETLVALIRT